MSRMPSLTVVLLPLTMLSLALSACHRPGGALMSRTGGSQTYASYETMPKTVQITDLRNGDVVFSMDIPPGKQLTLDFLSGDGTDPVYAPDLMRYQVFDNGTSTGRLRNMMSVPAAASRRIDISLRQAPEYAAAAPDRVLRTDELANQPDWWSAEGGDAPQDRTGLRNYED